MAVSALADRCEFVAMHLSSFVRGEANNEEIEISFSA